MAQCAACGAALPVVARFCPRCGRPAEDPAPATYTPRRLRDQILAVRGEITGERKQVTVLFADIVGSTSLALDLGPERLHRVVDRFFAVALEEVHRYEGTVNQFLGDGFMALFGAPIAHEDHARRALLAAIGIRERAEVELRMGVNSGLVVMGAIGDDLRMDYTAFGDTTIVAARLQAAATPGDVYVSTRTAHKVAGYFSFEAVPPVVVKEQTVEPLRLLGLGDRKSPLDRDVRLTALVGRDAEMRTLQGLVDDVVAGRGRLVGLAGEAGVGKSRLVFECGRLAQERATVIEGRCLSYGSRIAYLPLLDVVRQVCGVVVSDPPERVARKVSLALAALDVDAGHATYLLHALGVAESREPSLLDPPMVLRHTFDAVRSVLLAEARRRPLVLVIEDLHWIDRTSHDFLLELAGVLDAERVLLIATYRPVYAEGWPVIPFAPQIDLAPLHSEDGARIVRAMLGADAEAVDAIVERGEGNPFFLEELANAERAGAVGDGRREVPDTVQDVLAARIDALDRPQKAAIQIGAVLGREFTVALAEAVWDAAEPLLPVLHELELRDFVRDERTGAGTAFSFKHVLTRDVAYEGLLEARRQELHARAGAALEEAYRGRLHEQCELLAYHYSHSADRDRALDYLELANRKAASRHAMEEAIGYFYEALAILEAQPDSEANRRRRLALLFDQTPEFHWTNRHHELHELLLRHESVVAAIDDAALTGTFYGRLSHRLLIFGRYREAFDTATRGLEACDLAGNAEAAELCCMVRMWTNMMRGDFAGATSEHVQARARLDEHFDAVWFMYVQVGIGLAHLSAGRWDDAMRELDEAAESGVERSDAGTTSFARAFAAEVSLERGDWDRALELAESALQLAPTVYFRGYAGVFHAAALCHTGQSERGLPVLEQIVPMIRSAGHELGWSWTARRLALAYVAAGRPADAREVVNALHDGAVRNGAPFLAGSGKRLLAELALADGDAAAAVELLVPAVDTLRAHGCQHELALALATLTRAQRLAGDAGEVRLAP